MAKSKVNSFEEYDARSGTRLEHARDVARRKADAVIRKKKASLDAVIERETRIAVLGSLREVSETGRVPIAAIERFGRVVDDVIHREGSESEVEALGRQFKEDLFKEYLSSCISDLVDCGRYLIRSSPERLLPEGAQHDIYSRFATALTSVYARYGPLVSDVPDVVDVVNYYFLPQLPEQVETVKGAVNRLAAKGYIGKKDAERILFLFFEAPGKKKESCAAETPVARPAPVVAADAVKPVAEVPVVEEDVVGYLDELFGMDGPVAEEIAAARSIEQIKVFYGDLTRVVGETGANMIICLNPAVLGYANGKATKFLSNLEDVLNAQHEARGLFGAEADEYEFNPENIHMFTDSETLSSLKQKLFSRIRGVKFPPKPLEGAIDVEDYKNKLVSKAGLDVEVVRAITSGKTLHFTGEVYMPAEYFRKNSSKKIAPQKMEIFADVFDALVGHDVIVRKPKTTLLYRFNPHVSEVANKYLQEYMRITLYAEQIVAQEGELKLNENLVKELYPSGNDD
jgi:hypothetical protein